VRGVPRRRNPVPLRLLVAYEPPSVQLARRVDLASKIGRLHGVAACLEGRDPREAGTKKQQRGRLWDVNAIELERDVTR
jgi:hypothetical protein